MILVNGADEETARYLQEISTDSRKIILHVNQIPKKVGDARNYLIQKASGDFICFIDDDIELPTDYFLKASEYLKKYSDLDCFGGPDQTKQSASDFQLILGEVMKTYLAMGPTAKRHKSVLNTNLKGDEINLILCNLWIRRSIFREGFSFPANYVRNEENILLAQLESAGKKLIYFADLIVYHERKASFKKLISATFYSGMYRTIGFFDEKKTIKWYFFIPQLTIIWMMYLLMVDRELLLKFVFVYLAINIFVSFKIVTKLNKISKLHLAVSFFVVYNIIYTIGMFTGYYQKIKSYVK